MRKRRSGRAYVVDHENVETGQTSAASRRHEKWLFVCFSLRSRFSHLAPGIDAHERAVRHCKLRLSAEKARELVRRMHASAQRPKKRGWNRYDHIDLRKCHLRKQSEQSVSCALTTSLFPMQECALHRPLVEQSRIMARPALDVLNASAAKISARLLSATETSRVLEQRLEPFLHPSSSAGATEGRHFMRSVFDLRTSEKPRARCVMR
jgi:hypothetical protein